MLEPLLVTCQRAVIAQSPGTEVRVCRWCTPQLACNGEECNQPLTAPASSSCSQAGERGSHQSQKGPCGRRISIQTSVRTSLYPRQTHPGPQARPPVLFLKLPLANLSFFVFQQESNNLIPAAFIPPTPPLHALSTQLSFLSFFRLASRLLLRTPSACD